MGAVSEKIEKKLRDLLAPTVFKLQNDSASHSGHYQGDGETHFSLLLVATSLAGKSKVERHRLIYKELKEEFDQGLHALAIEAFTPEEYEQKKN